MENKDYKIMVELMHDMKENIDILKETISRRLHDEYHLKDTIIDSILPIMMEDIDTMDIEEIEEMLDKHTTKGNILIPHSDSENREIFKTIKEMSLVLYSAQKEYDDIRKDMADIMDEYVEYMSSEKVKTAREKRLERMKELSDSETDPVQKKKIDELINTTESATNFSFLQERFEKFGEKEIENIMEGFFKKKKGDYIIDKYSDKIKQFGYNPLIYRYFFNIEENFLPEEYHDFNNLFLFIYMRMVAYANANDKKDKMFVRSLTGALAELFYHKMDDVDETAFLEIVKTVDNNFKDKKDYFRENNTTSPNHEMRKEQNMKLDEKRKKAILDKFCDLKYPNYSELMNEANEGKISVDELYKKFDEYVNELLEKQLKKDIPDEITEETLKEENNKIEKMISKQEEEIIESDKKGVAHVDIPGDYE